MTAYLVLLLAALSRFFPHAFHGVGLNFTAVGGGLLYFGARRPRWQALAGAGTMAATDVLLTRLVYNYPFHLQDYALTWIWYAAVCLLGHGLLRRGSLPRVAGAVLGSATSFFVVSNLVVWAEGGLYPRDAQGFATCYQQALPFYANDLVSTALTAAVLFGLPVVARQIISTWRAAAATHQPFL